MNQKSDEQLIELIQGKDPDLHQKAIDEIFSRYKEYVKKRTIPYFMMGADKEDLIQEGMIGLYKAVVSFDPDKEASFQTFADLCIRRQILTAVKFSNRLKHYPLNHSISLNSAIQQEDGEDQELTLIDQLTSDRIDNPEEILVSREERARLEARILEKLSSLEMKVMGLYISGLNYQEIAKALDRSPKSIDNALQRARKKANEVLEKH